MQAQTRRLVFEFKSRHAQRRWSCRALHKLLQRVRDEKEKPCRMGKENGRAGKKTFKIDEK